MALAKTPSQTPSTKSLPGYLHRGAALRPSVFLAEYSIVKVESIYLAKDGEKRCSRCKLKKPVKDFYRNKARKDGFNHYCKKCANEATAASVDARKDLESRQSIRSTRDTVLRDRFGVSLRATEYLTFEQNNRCPICHNELDTPIPDIGADGAVRALLCSTCFTGVTMFRNSEEMLERALSYLRSFKEGNDLDVIAGSLDPKASNFKDI